MMSLNKCGFILGQASVLALAFAHAPRAENIWLFQNSNTAHRMQDISMSAEIPDSPAARDSAQPDGKRSNGLPDAYIHAGPRADGTGRAFAYPSSVEEASEMILLDAGQDNLLQLHQLSIGW